MTPENAEQTARKARGGRRQAFQLAAAEAKGVWLVGDFTQWQEHGIRMRKGRNGVWTASVELSPGKHSYRFIVDGDWRDDPECKSRVPNPFGGEDMVREAA